MDQQANAALTQRLNQVRDDVNALENRIQQTRQKYQLVQTRAGSVSQQQLEDMSTALTRASSDRAALQANYARATALASTGEVSQDSAQVLSSTTISTLRDREAAAERQVAQLSQSFGPSYPALRAAQAELGAARGALAAEARRVVVALGAEVQAARQREADLQQQLAAAQAKASQVATVQADLQQLEKDVDARRALYQTLLVSTEQTETTKQGPRQIGSHVVSLATPPLAPSSPRPKLAAAFGLVGGFAFGGLIAFFRRTGEITFQDPEQLAAITGLDVLPSIPRARRGRGLRQTIATDPGGAEAEAMRAHPHPPAVPRHRAYAALAALPVQHAWRRQLQRGGGLRTRRRGRTGCGCCWSKAISPRLRSPSCSMSAKPALSSTFCTDTRIGVRPSPATMRRRSTRCSPQPIAKPMRRDSAQLVESMQLQNVLVEARDDYGLIVLDGPPITESGSAAIARAVGRCGHSGRAGRDHHAFHPARGARGPRPAAVPPASPPAERRLSRPPSAAQDPLSR